MPTNKVRLSKGRERNAESGAIAIIMGLSLTMLLGFAALGFDLSYVRLARLEMKNATDAAAHAAILILRSSASSANAKDNSTAAGIAVAAQNTVLGKSMVLTGNDFAFGTWDSAGQIFTAGAPYTAVKINGVRDVAGSGGYVNLTFGRVLGYSEASTTQDTIGAFANRNFMLEMDITPSYICNIDNAVMADLSLLNGLHDQKIGGDRISLDVFTGMAVQFNDFINIRDHYADIYYWWSGGATPSETPSTTYTPFLTTGASPKSSGITVCKKTDDLTGANGGTFQCPDDGTKSGPSYVYPNNPNIMYCSGTAMTGYTSTVYAGTDIGAAITAGTAKLVAETRDFEPRILIVVTDGEPMMCTAPQGGDLCSNNAYPCCSDGWCTQANADAHDPIVGGASLPAQKGRSAVCHAAHDQLNAGPGAADAAAAANIDLFMVKLRGTSTDSSAVYAQSLVRGKGTFTWLADATTLATAFTNILGEVPISLVK